MFPRGFRIDADPRQDGDVWKPVIGHAWRSCSTGVVELSPPARAEFLASLTRTDAELAPELEALLDGHEPEQPLPRRTAAA